MHARQEGRVFQWERRSATRGTRTAQAWSCTATMVPALCWTMTSLSSALTAPNRPADNVAGKLPSPNPASWRTRNGGRSPMRQWTSGLRGMSAARQIGSSAVVCSRVCRRGGLVNGLSTLLPETKRDQHLREHPMLGRRLPLNRSNAVQRLLPQSWTIFLITRRSQVQILPPPPRKPWSATTAGQGFVVHRPDF